MEATSPQGIEVLRPPSRREFRLVLFDFDGTLSLLREGWPSVMIPLMAEVLSPLQTGLSPDQVQALLSDDVAELTGRPTRDQMVRLADRVRQFGGTPLDPRAYKAEYNRRLLARIDWRRESIRAGTMAPDTMLLAGARPLLQALSARHLLLCLTSGTDEPYVREEAALLDIADYFGPHIYGATDDDKTSSKSGIIARLLRTHRMRGEEVLVFSDGFVEIESGKRVGGYAVCVASNEATGGGRVDPWKRERLLRAGADMIIPDYACYEELLRRLFPSPGGGP
jgi:phosphoglycolate phosphatase-like HAD superfamily hydrolase